MQFPIFKTKVEGVDKKFNLTDPKEQKEYFKLKAGPEIEKIKMYLESNTFVAYLLGKKNSGKGTYSKMFVDLVGADKFDHFSIGDMIRVIDKELADPKAKEELVEYLKKNYRGRYSVEEAVVLLENRSTKTLLPTELILVLVKRELERREKKALFIDGFPRDLDQINFSLFFRDLIGHRDDADVFILIDVPEQVIDERIKWRKICPSCLTSRNLKLLPTSKVGYDKEKKEFYLICDNPKCENIMMVSKEGDDQGIEPIRQRLITDGKLMEQAFSLFGIPKILLRNSLPAETAKEYVDDYEITPEYYFEWDEDKQMVNVKEKSWTFSDDQGQTSYSLLAQPVVISLIKQMVDILNL